jgi:hypothetical protein
MTSKAIPAISRAAVVRSPCGPVSTTAIRTLKKELYKVINNPDIQLKNNDNSIWSKIDKYNEYEGILSAVLDLLKKHIKNS